MYARGQGAASVPLEREFQWDPLREIPFPRSNTPQVDPSLLAAQVKRGQAGASRDLNCVVVPRDASLRATFQRRSLVLSRMVQQVKRRSAGIKSRKRMSIVPPLPNKIARRLIPSQGPSAWVEVDKSKTAPPPHVPSPTYRPNQSTMYEDLGDSSTRSRYHSFNTPIADQFAYHAR
jgi:hypothetical protein